MPVRSLTGLRLAANVGPANRPSRGEPAMTPNGIRRLWAEGKPVLNGWLSIGNAFTAEIMAQQGYDAVHCRSAARVGRLTRRQPPCCRPCAPAPQPPWCACPGFDPGDIMKALDAGALGIVCPMIKATAPKPSASSPTCAIRPMAQRSFGPTRAVFAHGSDYGQHANRPSAEPCHDRDGGRHGQP